MVFAYSASTHATSTSRKRSKKLKVGKPPHNLTPPVGNDTADLSDFIDYLADEIYPSLPPTLQTLSHKTLQDTPSLAEEYALPLPPSTIDSITSILPPCINDTLTTYAFLHPPTTDLSSLLTPLLTTYITATTTPPKSLSPSTYPQPSSCEICSRLSIPLTYHHLIPRQIHAKALKRNWHDQASLNNVAWLCRPCHSFVHSMASNEQLAREYFTLQRIVEREDAQRWAGWVGQVRWGKR